LTWRAWRRRRPRGVDGLTVFGVDRETGMRLLRWAEDEAGPKLALRAARKEAEAQADEEWQAWGRGRGDEGARPGPGGESRLPDGGSVEEAGCASEVPA